MEPQCVALDAILVVIVYNEFNQLSALVLTVNEVIKQFL